MRILAFDTASRATAVALATPGGLWERRDDPPIGQRPAHASRLLPLISTVMDEAGLEWPEIDRIAVGLGPGTFTGLRIGVATAKALGQASGTPLVGVSTLHALAVGTGGPDGADRDAVLALLDARRGELYAGAWSPQSLEGPPLLTPRALSPEALRDALPGLGSRPLAVGEGAVAFRDVLERAGVDVPSDCSELHRVTAASHCRLARRLPVTSPDELAPDYQRLPDAQPRSTTAATPDRRRGG
ncbi:MAG TPA: tRNA (adenosine(37)-N6)-threonylcarbamoyltransferase complex dimerization subunit type 1 TsaB [Solirubrobacteraceae bacterium]